MLAVEKEAISEELRRELIVFLHLTREELSRLTSEERVRGALEGLSEVRGLLIAVDLEHAALKISIPPFLRSDRLRGVLKRGLATLFGRMVGTSIRLPGELADTVEASRNVALDWSDDERAVLCLTDEGAVGEPVHSLSDLREFLEEKVDEHVSRLFPINYYDVLCLWEGSVNPIVWGPDRTISGAYGELTKTSVSSTAHSLEAMNALVAHFQA